MGSVTDESDKNSDIKDIKSLLRELSLIELGLTKVELDEIKETFKSRDCIKMRDKKGRSFIFYTNSEMTDELLKFTEDGGYDVNLQDADGNTALHKAASDADYDKINVLITNGAFLGITNNAGKVPTLIRTDSSKYAKAFFSAFAVCNLLVISSSATFILTDVKGWNIKSAAEFTLSVMLVSSFMAIAISAIIAQKMASYEISVKDMHAQFEKQNSPDTSLTSTSAEQLQEEVVKGS